MKRRTFLFAAASQLAIGRTQQPQVFELAVNLKAAREQGIAIPQSILVRATKIIE